MALTSTKGLEIQQENWKGKENDFSHSNKHNLRN